MGHLRERWSVATVVVCGISASAPAFICRPILLARGHSLVASRRTRMLPGTSPHRTRKAKAAGNANNDWALTHRLVVERWAPGTPPPAFEEVKAAFEDIYQGGLWRTETLIISETLLHRLHAHGVPMVGAGHARQAGNECVRVRACVCVCLCVRAVRIVSSVRCSSLHAWSRSALPVPTSGLAGHWVGRMSVGGVFYSEHGLACWVGSCGPEQVLTDPDPGG